MLRSAVLLLTAFALLGIAPPAATASLNDVCPAEAPQKLSCAMFRSAAGKLQGLTTMDPRRVTIKLTGDNDIRGKCGPEYVAYKRVTTRIVRLGGKRLKRIQLTTFCPGHLVGGKRKDRQVDTFDFGFRDELGFVNLRFVARKLRERTDLRRKAFGKPLLVKGSPSHMILRFKQRGSAASIQQVDIRGDKLTIKRYAAPYTLPS